MSSLLSGERPLNGNLMAIHTTAPGLSLSPQRNSISDPAFAQALSREQTDCDFGLVQPAAVARRVVQRKSTPQPTSPFFAEALHYCFAGMRTQIVQHQVNGVGFGIASGDIQQVVCEVGRGAMCRDFGEVSSGFRLHPTEHVGSAATTIFAIPSRHLPRRHGPWGTNFLVQHHRLLIHTNHRLSFTQRFLVHGQNVLHPPDIVFIQFRHAPHFFPATASARGFPAGHGWSRVPRAAPVCASPPLRSAGVPSNARGLRASDHTPRRRSVVAVGRRAKRIYPAAGARTRLVPSRLADISDWSATPSSGSMPSSWRPAGPFAPLPIAAEPRPAAPFARAASQPSIRVAVPAAPALPVEPELASSCPSYKLRHHPKQVSRRSTIHVVTVLERFHELDQFLPFLCGLTDARDQRIVDGGMTQGALNSHRYQFPLVVEVAGYADHRDELEQGQSRGWIVEIDLTGFELIHQSGGKASKSTFRPTASAVLGLTPGPTPPSFSPAIVWWRHRASPQKAFVAKSVEKISLPCVSICWA